MSTVDMSIESKSDQLDYQDMLAGPITITISEVRKGPSGEQPVEILAPEITRPWRPSKGMRRVLVAAWGKDPAPYVGRRVRLYGDPNVKWAGKPVGGIRVEALSGIDAPLTVQLTVARGKRDPFTVQPLQDVPQAPAWITREQWEQITTAAAEKGITEPLAWCAGFVSRELTSPQQITAEEAGWLIQAVNS